jgi:NAD(P)-dependent dehydrogenase (short-subunit alcohol dehydrogenase family)
MSHDGWLAGKVALLSGAGSGIGRAVVDAYRAEGARVCVLELSQAKCDELQGSEPEVAVVQGDATDPAANARAVGETLERFGRLDVLGTFAGIFDLYTPLADIPAESFDAAYEETFAVNVKSAMLATRAALPALRDARGSIVMTLSSSSFYPGRGGALYVASKFALRGLVLQLAHDLAPEVRVNGVAPGGTVSTDLRGLRSLGQFDTILDARPNREEELRARTPLEVALRPEDHATAYVFLASERSRGITGEVVRSDGGLGVR